MANPTRNDLEYSKFKLTSIGDIYVDAEVVILDPLAEPTGTTNDLEFQKFNSS